MGDRKTRRDGGHHACTSKGWFDVGLVICSDGRVAQRGRWLSSSHSTRRRLNALTLAMTLLVSRISEAVCIPYLLWRTLDLQTDHSNALFIELLFVCGQVAAFNIPLEACNQLRRRLVSPCIRGDFKMPVTWHVREMPSLIGLTCVRVEDAAGLAPASSCAAPRKLAGGSRLPARPQGAPPPRQRAR